MPLTDTAKRSKNEIQENLFRLADVMREPESSKSPTGMTETNDGAKYEVNFCVDCQHQIIKEYKGQQDIPHCTHIMRLDPVDKTIYPCSHFRDSTGTTCEYFE